MPAITNVDEWTIAGNTGIGGAIAAGKV